MLARYGPVSRCPSLCVSVTSLNSTKTAKCIITRTRLTTLPQPRTSGSLIPIIVLKFPPTGAPNTYRAGKTCNSRQITCYIENGTSTVFRKDKEELVYAFYRMVTVPMTFSDPSHPMFFYVLGPPSFSRTAAARVDKLCSQIGYIKLT